MRQFTCQFQRIGLRFISHIIHDVLVSLPRRDRGIRFVAHQDPNQLQYVRVPQTLPSDYLSAEALQTVRLSQKGRPKSLAFSIVWIPSCVEYVIILTATGLPSYIPRQTLEKPPVDTGAPFSFAILDSVRKYGAGRTPYSPQSFMRPRKHRLLVFKLIRQRRSNNYLPLVRCTNW